MLTFIIWAIGLYIIGWILLVLGNIALAVFESWSGKDIAAVFLATVVSVLAILCVVLSR